MERITMKTENQQTMVPEDSSELYYVVKNTEEQYSIWPHYKKIPEGWEAVGEPKPKAECLAYIENIWTDMRPLSLRRQMEELASRDKKISF
jgi:MbtH protein